MPNSINCPVCRADYRASETLCCRRCGANLAPLIRLYDQSVWHYQQAISAFEFNNLSVAQQQIECAIALNIHCVEFHAFAGQLWALQGKFDRALSAWQCTRAIDANHPIAKTAQQMFLSAVQPDEPCE